MRSIFQVRVSQGSRECASRGEDGDDQGDDEKQPCRIAP